MVAIPRQNLWRSRCDLVEFGKSVQGILVARKRHGGFGRAVLSHAYESTLERSQYKRQNLNGCGLYREVGLEGRSHIIGK